MICTTHIDCLVVSEHNMLVEVSNSRTSIVVNAGKADASTDRRIPKSIDIADIRRGGGDDGKVAEGNGSNVVRLSPR